MPNPPEARKARILRVCRIALVRRAAEGAGGGVLPPPGAPPVEGLLRFPSAAASFSSSMTLNVVAKPSLMFPLTETMFVASSALWRTVSFLSVVGSFWG